MSPAHPPVMAGIELELDRLDRQLQQLLRLGACSARSQLIADLFDHQAWLWSLLFERTRNRLTWRAALGAQAYARESAKRWRASAATQAHRQPSPRDGVLGPEAGCRWVEQPLPPLGWELVAKKTGKWS